jgi:hypothetical protein
MRKPQRIIERVKHPAGSSETNHRETGTNQRLCIQHVDIRNDEIRRVNKDINTLMGRSALK